MKNILVSSLLLTCMLFLVACTETTQPEAVTPEEVKQPADDALKEFQVNGVVREVIAERDRLRVEHEEIPDYMDAMTMVLKVKDSGDLTRFKEGDPIAFRMVVTADDGWIDGVVKIEGASPVTSPYPTSYRRVLDVDPLAVGDLMPDYHFTNEQGKAVSISDFKGKSVGLTFIFTSCPFPTFCPRMSGNFAAAQAKLKAREGGPDNWHLLSVTIDPQNDTPEVLAGYAKGYGYDAERWSYLTGKLIDITAIAEQFGLMFWRPDPKDKAGISHNLRTVVIDANGRVQNILPENEWTVDSLVAAIVKGMKPEGIPKPPEEE